MYYVENKSMNDKEIQREGNELMWKQTILNKHN